MRTPFPAKFVRVCRRSACAARKWAAYLTQSFIHLTKSGIWVDMTKHPETCTAGCTNFLIWHRLNLDWQVESAYALSAFLEGKCTKKGWIFFSRFNRFVRLVFFREHCPTMKGKHVFFTAAFLETNVEGYHYVLVFRTKSDWTFGGNSGQQRLRALSKNTQSEDGNVVGKKQNILFTRLFRNSRKVTSQYCCITLETV